MAEPFTSIPDTLSLYRIPEAILHSTARAFREVGIGERESVALWQGQIVNEFEAIITKLHVPKQVAGPLHFNVPLEERIRLVREVSSQNEFILVQLHTHPREAFHSDVDDRLAITKHKGALSIVIPDFGMQWQGDLLQTSVNRNLGGGQWVELPDFEVSRILVVES